MESFDRSVTVGCDAFVFEDHEVTILNQFDLTCDSEFKLALIGAIHSLGSMFCLMFDGTISDKFGRKIIIIVGALASGIFGMLRVFATNYIQFATFEFVDALFSSGIYGAAYIIGLELVTPRLRTISGTILNVFYAFGGIYLGVIAMFFRNYRVLLFISYIPSFIILAYSFFLPQSVRWLLSKGEHEKSKKILDTASKINGTKLNDQTVNWFNERIAAKKSMDIIEEPTENEGWMKSITCKIVLQILNLAYCWFSTEFVYYGLNLNSIYLEHWNKYINFILVTAIELPAYFVTIFMMEKLGRKKTLFIGMIGSGIFCILAEAIPGDMNKTILFICGKLMITIAYGCIYIFTIEIFPTNLRHRFFSICNLAGRIGSILMPLTPLLIQFSPSLPLLIFGFLAFSSAIFLCTLPETNNRKLPENIKEAFD